MYNKYKQKFAIKKFTVGVASVFIGATALMSTDVLPFDIANVASANESNVETESVTKDGINYELKNHNTKEYSLNGKSEYLMLKLQGVNAEAAKDSISIVVEKTGPIKVSISSPVEDKKAETIGNTTTLKLGSFTEGSYYSIPIFTEYEEYTDNNTPSSIIVKVVDNVTGEVIYNKTHNQINRASEIIELQGDNEIEYKAGKYNTLTNEVVENNFYTIDKSLEKLSKTIYNNNYYPAGGDKIVTTIISGEDVYKVENNKILPIRYREYTTTPLIVRQEVFNSQGVSKNIVKEITITPVWENVSEYTEYKKVESNDKHLNPGTTINDEDIIELKDNTYVLETTSRYNHDNLVTHSAILTTPIKKVPKLGETANINNIEYSLLKTNPKELSMEIAKETGSFKTSPKKAVSFVVDFNVAKIKNFQNSKFWYKTSDSEEKHYFNNGKTFLNYLDEFNTTGKIISYDDYNNYFNEVAGDSLNNYLLKTTGETLSSYIDNTIASYEITEDISNIENIIEVGIDFDSNFEIEAKDLYENEKKSFSDVDVMKKGIKNPSAISVNLKYNDNDYATDSILETKSKILYEDGINTIANPAKTIVDKTNYRIHIPKLRFADQTGVPKIEGYMDFDRLTLGPADGGILNVYEGEHQVNRQYKIKSPDYGPLSILIKKVNGITVTPDNTIYTPKDYTITTEHINGEEYLSFNIANNNGVYDIKSFFNFAFRFKDNEDMLKNNKIGEEIVAQPISVYIKIPHNIPDFYAIHGIDWNTEESLSNNEYDYYKAPLDMNLSIVPAEGLILKDYIKRDNDNSKINIIQNDTLKITTEIKNITTNNVDDMVVIQVVPKNNSLKLNGEKSDNYIETNFVELSEDYSNDWDVYYSTTVRQEGESVNVITDWTREVPADKTKITHLKWVKKSHIPGGTNPNISFKTQVVDRYYPESYNDYEMTEKIHTVSGFNLGNNAVWGQAESSNVTLKEQSRRVTLEVYIDENNNNKKDINEVAFSTYNKKLTQADPAPFSYPIAYSINNSTTNLTITYKNSELFANNNINTLDLVTENNEKITEDITDASILSYVYNSLNTVYDYEANKNAFDLLKKKTIKAIGSSTKNIRLEKGFGEKTIDLSHYIILSDEREPLTIKYYDTSTGEIVKTESSLDYENTMNVGYHIKKSFVENKNVWVFDDITLHTHPITKEEITEENKKAYMNDGIIYYNDEVGNPVPYIGKALEVYVPVRADKAGKVDVILKDKETGEPLKITNLVTENTEKKGTTVTITDTVAPNYITIGDNTYKKVEKPNLPTEAIVPGETDNADVEFEYELVRGAVYGVFKAENGNNIVKDKVTIIEGGQPEDTRVEYTAPSKITDDNGKVWELVTPQETVSYTNSEKATEHILTYREVKKNITVKYVTESGEVIKEETAFENKSVGSKYTINTPETITKDNVIYNVSGEREVSGVVEDNDNIVTIQVTPKQKQVAIVKFVDNNGEEIAGIERKRVEGYDGTPINVTLNNISNYRITTNPFETPQVFDTDNNVDQEFNVVLEKLPTTAIPFETEYVADDTREYGSENIVEREGEEGVREENGEISKQPVNKIIKVATGTKVERKETPFNVIYEADESKSFGDNTTETGKNKVEEITTTYTLDSSTGNVTSETSTTVVEDGSPEIHKLGTKAKTEVETVEYKTEYIEDKTLEYGKEKVITEGVAGEKTTTTTYRLDGDTVVANNPIVEITKQSTNKVVAKGTKATETVIKETPFTTITKEDSTLNKGEEVVEVEGVNGKTVTITEYTLNKETGEVTSVTREEVREAVNKVVRVGTKETTTNVETDTPTAEEEKAKEDKNSDAWEETANEYNKQKETVETKDNTASDKTETITNENSKENNSEVKVENKVVQDAEVKAKELPKTNTNSTLLYSATALIGLATLLRRKQNQ